MVPQMSKMGAKENKHRLKLIIQEMNKPTSMGLGSCQSKTKKSKNVQENPHDGCKSLIRFGYDFASFVDASLDFMQLSHNVNWTALNLGTSSSSGLKKNKSPLPTSTSNHVAIQSHLHKFLYQSFLR